MHFVGKKIKLEKIFSADIKQSWNVEQEVIRFRYVWLVSKEIKNGVARCQITDIDWNVIVIVLSLIRFLPKWLKVMYRLRGK